MANAPDGSTVTDFTPCGYFRKRRINVGGHDISRNTNCNGRSFLASVCSISRIESENRKWYFEGFFAIVTPAFLWAVTASATVSI